MTVREGSLDEENIGGTDEGFTLEEAVEGFDLMVGPIREVGESLLMGFVSLAPGATEKDSGRGFPIGHAFDIHGRNIQFYVHYVKSNNIITWAH
jgi:hypothetical protein